MRLNTDNRDTMPITDATYGRKSGPNPNAQKDYSPRGHLFRFHMSPEVARRLREAVSE